MATVRVEDREGGVRVLTLDRPPANAENEELLGDLGTALAEARGSDAVRAIVLTGAGRFFSGGFDLSAPRRDDDSGHLFRNLFRATHLALLALPKPTAALVAEAVGRVEAETPEEAARGAAVWATAESRAARAAQRAKLGMR